MINKCMNNLTRDLNTLSQNLNAINQAVASISTQINSTETQSVPFRSLSGDHIRGGTYFDFRSVGIVDNASKTVVSIEDKGIVVDSIDVKNLLGDTNLTGSLYIKNDLHVNSITATKLHVKEIKTDVKQIGPLEFHTTDDKTLYGSGLLWKGQGNTKQFIYRANPDRIWSTESIDLQEEAFYSIGNIPVLRLHELGSSVRHSQLTTVGTLQNLRTAGNLNLDEFIFYESSTNRLSLGTDAPNGTLSIGSLDSEFVINVEGPTTRLGNWTTDDLEIITDDTVRILVSAHGNITIGSNLDNKTQVIGKLGINVKNPDCDIETAGPIKIQNKKFEVGSSLPKTGNYRKGDIVWNENPKPSGYVGWICTRDGTPGEWKPFGIISS